MRQITYCLAAAAAALLCLLTACQSHSPSSDSTSALAAKTGLDAAWMKPGLSRESYRKLIVRPVNTRYLLDNAGWQAANPTNAELPGLAQDLATFTRETFISAFTHDPNYRFGLVGWADSDVLVLEVAIVELMPSETVLKALDLRAPSGEKPSRPRVAIEGRLRDSITGETLIAFADRAEPKTQAYKELTWWAFTQPVIRKWAAQCVQLANSSSPANGENEPPFRLHAW